MTKSDVSPDVIPDRLPPAAQGPARAADEQVDSERLLRWHRAQASRIALGMAPEPQPAQSDPDDPGDPVAPPPDDPGHQYASALRALRQLSSELDNQVVQRTAERTTELAESNRQLLREADEHRRTTQQLQQSRARLSRLTTHQETLREEQRQRVARDVHDELGQNLLALRIDIAQLQARASLPRGRLRRRIDAALDNVDSIIRSVRGIMNELRPAVLDLGLYAAVEWQVREFQQRSGLACTLLLPPEAQVPALAAPFELALFRNLQEALLNVLRHAHASAVEVRLALDGGALTLSVADDGVGLDPASCARQDVFGLAGMEQRMAALGGRLRIDSPTPGAGCRLTLSFDL